MKKKKTPDYGQPSDTWSKLSPDGSENIPDPRFRDYYKKPTAGSRNKLVHDFYDAVIRKSFVLGTEGRFTFDEDAYTKRSLDFFEQVFLKVTIDTENDRCLGAQINYADLDRNLPHEIPAEMKIQEFAPPPAHDDVDFADIGLDPKETSRIYAGMEKHYSPEKIDITRLHKCGEIHVPLSRHDKEDK